MFPSYSSVRTKLKPQLDRVESERHKLLRLLRWAFLTCLFGVVALIVFPQFEMAEYMYVIMIAPFITSVVFFLLYYRFIGRYRKSFKELVIRGITGELVENCSLPNETEQYVYTWDYHPDDRIHDHYILNSFLFQDRIDEINGEDLIYGRLGLTDFEFSELYLIKISYFTDSKGHQRELRFKVFDGVLFVADFHKSLQGRTILRQRGPLGIGRFFNRVNAIYNKFGADQKKYKIQLENTEFNRMFDTYTTDEIEARYILSPTLMERLVGFSKAHRKGVEVAFVGERMYIAIHTLRNYFEPKLFKSVADVQAKQVYDDLFLFFSTIEWFDLNTRIWNK